MTTGAATLTRAVRFTVIGHYLGQLAAMLALLTVPPLALALAFGEPAFAWRYALVVALLVAASRIARRLPVPERIQANEALVIVALTFISAALLETFALTASGLPFVDVLFEAISAVTTTGLTTVAEPRALTPTFLFARAWMQWYGGLGIAALSVALLMGHRVAARRFIENSERDNIAATARLQARQVLLAYVGLSGVGVVLLWPLLGDGFGALTYMLSTVSTGGFAPDASSLAGMPPAAAWVITVFSLCGALPLVLLFAAARGQVAELLRDAEVLTLALLLVAGAVLLALSLHVFSAFDWAAALRHGAQLGVSAQTTTGFSGTAIRALDPVSKTLILFAMIVGGCCGSTAGGVKVLRLVVMGALLRYSLRRSSMPPHAADRPRVAGHTLDAETIERTALIIVLFAAVAGLCWLAFLAHGYAPLDALLEVISALATVGLSAGITGPILETPLKYLLCLAMLFGRLEFLAVLVLVYPRTWIGRRG